MKSTSRFGIGVAGALLAASILGGITGCEKNAGDGTRFLTINPPSVLMGTNIVWVTLTVVDGTRDLSTPLEWNAENPGMGDILRPTAGFSAIYARTPNNGINVVTVRDEYGAEGYVHINQVAYWTPDPSTNTTTLPSTNVAAVVVP